METNNVFDKIKSDGLLPLFYHDDVAVCIAICKALYKGGVSCIEFTNRGVNALENFKALVKERNEGMHALLLGIGTITTATEATDFIDNGADFLVSPFYDKEINDVAKSRHIVYIPGCMTPRDIHIAKNAGCNFIKLFPGNVLGPDFLQAVKPLFRDMEFIVTGGVENDEDNLMGWFNSGVVGVGMGSKLITNTMVANKEYEKLYNTTAMLLNFLKTINNNNLK